MKEKITRFMIGRYGVDQFNKFLLGSAFGCMLVSWFIRNGVFHTLALAILVYCYYRMLSKNNNKRYQENMIYLKYYNKVKMSVLKQKNYLIQSKEYHIYTCSNCKQKIRIPRGKGKISITCPKCKNEFIKKS